MKKGVFVRGIKVEVRKKKEKTNKTKTKKLQPRAAARFGCSLWTELRTPGSLSIELNVAGVLLTFPLSKFFAKVLCSGAINMQQARGRRRVSTTPGEGRDQ